MNVTHISISTIQRALYLMVKLEEAYSLTAQCCLTPRNIFVYQVEQKIKTRMVGRNLFILLTGDRRQTKQFCFYIRRVVGESQSSSRRSAGKYPVKTPRPEGDSQTIDTYLCRNSRLSFASVASGMRTCTERGIS